jgi:hypothetical protein
MVRARVGDPESPDPPYSGPTCPIYTHLSFYLIHTHIEIRKSVIEESLNNPHFKRISFESVERSSEVVMSDMVAYIEIILTLDVKFNFNLNLTNLTNF